jgi:hypothetical protein
MESPSNYPLSSYLEAPSAAAVFRLRARPQSSPIDINLAFLAHSGWNQSWIGLDSTINTISQDL